MADEDFERFGFIEETPYLYNQIAGIGVPARVWDEVIDEMYDLASWAELPSSFTDVLFDWSVMQEKRFDYTRAENVTDHEYARGLLLQADEAIAANHAAHPELPEDDGEDCAAMFEQDFNEKQQRHRDN